MFGTAVGVFLVGVVLLAVGIAFRDGSTNYTLASYAVFALATVSMWYDLGSIEAQDDALWDISRDTWALGCLLMLPLAFPTYVYLRYRYELPPEYKRTFT